MTRTNFIMIRLETESEIDHGTLVAIQGALKSVLPRKVEFKGEAFYQGHHSSIVTTINYYSPRQEST